MSDSKSRAIERAILLLTLKAADKSICPSEVARNLDPEGFRALMSPVRNAAARLCKRGLIVATQRGRHIDPLTARGPIRLARPPPEPARVRSAEKPPATSIYAGIDFRKHPEAYRVGRGEQGVLSAEPYKSELLPLWRFRTPEIARDSAQAIWKAFVRYRRARDFIGMDMARKFLQMGYTRSRRYANHASGRKYGASGKVLEADTDEGKARAALHFYEKWQQAERDPAYLQWRALQRKRPRVAVK